MSPQNIADVYFMQRRADFMGAGNDIFDRYADPIPFSKMLFESAGFPSNYKMMLPPEFT